MKVSFGYGVGAYSGKLKDVVFCHHKRSGRVYMRERVYPTLREHHHELGSVTANLHSIRPSEDYKEDMRIYIFRYNKLKGYENKQIRSWVNLYLKLMRQMAKESPGIDLRTLSREDIYTAHLPCISVKSAIEAGLLPQVYDWQRLDRQI